MASITKASAHQTSAESLGNFFGELFGHIGTLGAIPVTYIYTTVNEKLEKLSENNKNVKVVLDFVKTNHVEIAKGFFAVACFINFWYSPLIFTIGLCLGFIASYGHTFIKFKSLQEGELLGHTRERNYSSQIALSILAFLNLYLGNTLLDNAFFGVSCGLIAGNNLFHMFKNSENYKNVEAWVLHNLYTNPTEIE